MSIEVKFTFSGVAELQAFLAGRDTGPSTGNVVPSPDTPTGKAAPASRAAKADAPPATSPAPAPTPATAPKPVADEVTQETLSEAVMKLAALNTAKTVEVLAKYGAKRGKEVKVDDRAACLADVKAAIAAVEVA